MSHEESSYEELSKDPDRLALPIGEIFRATYGYVWRYRWPCLGQIVFWTLMMWLRQYPVFIISDALDWAGFGGPLDDFNLGYWLLSIGTELLFVVLGGGLIFLSCACAILFKRRPRAGDVLRLPAVKAFWIASFRFWICADLFLLVAIEVLYLYVAYVDATAPWVNPIGWRLAILVYPVAIWALIGMALPIAAFERPAAPFRAAWRRLRDDWKNVLLLFAIVAAPILLPQALWQVTPLREDLWISLAMTAPPVAFPYIKAAVTLGETFLSFLLILVLSATTVEVYKRLAPDNAELAKTFD